MADAAFYDGQSARRREVSLKVSASALDLHDGGEWVASWPVGRVRRRDAPEGLLRLTLDGGPPLARLDVADAQDRAAVLAACKELGSGEKPERTGRIVLWSMLAAVSLTLSAVFLLPVVAERLTPLIPVSLERHLGKAIDNQIRLVVGKRICADAPGIAALASLQAKLRQAGGFAPDAVTDVKVLDSAVPNAITLPGGRIYLFSALLDKARSVDEVAGVLAHEMGHAAHRDGLRKLIQSGGSSYLLGLLFGDVTGGAAIVIASRLIVDTSYSRDAETAADDFAGRTMTDLGRPAAAMGHLLKRIEGNESRIPAFLSTHPVTDQRLKALERQVPVHPGAPLLGDEEWRALKEICKTS